MWDRTIKQRGCVTLLIFKEPYKIYLVNAIAEMAGGALHLSMHRITPGKVSEPPQDTQWVSERTQFWESGFLTVNWKRLPCFLKAPVSQVSVQRPADQSAGALMMKMKFDGGLKNFCLLREVGLFISFKPSTEWTMPTHILESDLLFSSSV